MTEERLQLLPEDFLREIAKKEGIKFDPSLDKSELIDLIIEAIEEDRQENELANNPVMRIKERKFDVTLNEQFDFDEDKYPLPEKYNETKIVMLLRDPAWAFTYWDVKDSDVEEIQSGIVDCSLVLRVYQLLENEYRKANIADFFDIPVSIEDKSWYINLPEPGISYCVELMLSGHEWHKTLCRSSVVTSPLWEVSTLEENKALKNSGNDLLLVAGIYDMGNTEVLGKIPQRIISMIDSELLV